MRNGHPTTRGFLLNRLKALFRLSRALLHLYIETNSKRSYKICTCSSHPWGLHVLERSQGRAFEILNRPKAYEKFSEEGREPYKKIKSWLDQKDPIADIRGKMQGANLFITSQKLFIVTQVHFRKFQFSMSFIHPVHFLHGISNTTVATDFIWDIFFLVLIFFFIYLPYIWINREEQKSSRGQLMRESGILRFTKNGPSGLVQRAQVPLTRTT